MRVQVWTNILLLAFTTEFSSSAYISETYSTSDEAVEEVKEAAAIDFNFIKSDLQDLQQKYADSIETSNSNYIGRLDTAVNQTYEDNIPTEYNPMCFKLIYQDVQDMMNDLNGAMSVCAEISFSVMKEEQNLAQFQTIISSLGSLSSNLTNSINICLVEVPKISWEQLQCVFGKVDVFTSEYNPVLNKFKMFNVQMNGHLMLIGLDITRCYQQALQRIAEIKQAILIDVDICKVLS